MTTVRELIAELSELPHQDAPIRISHPDVWGDLTLCAWVGKEYYYTIEE